MDAAALTSILAERVLLLDGATGTELQKQGMPGGVCPELWVAAHPDSLRSVQSEYYACGCDIVLTCTFGATRPKLDAHGDHATDITELNATLGRITRQICPPGCLVAGDMGPTGRLIEPFGPLSFGEAVKIFQEQVRGLVSAGVDLLFIETMMDLQEARAALLAAREVTTLPVLVSMTYGEEGATLTGTSPEAAAVTLAAMGAQAVGCNCSTGPEPMRSLLERMHRVCEVPLFAKPNAGLPSIVDGATVFRMGAEAFAREAQTLVERGANLIGGCCGSSPEHLRALKQRVAELGIVPARSPAHRPAGPALRLASASAVHEVRAGELTIVGERINPTGKRTLREQLRAGQFSEIRRLAAEQDAGGAHVLDVNVGAPGIDEEHTLPKAVELLSMTTALPLCLDSTAPPAIEAALRVYPGRALINSVTAEARRLDPLLSLASRYGAAVIILPVDEGHVPETAAERVAVVERILDRARHYGLRDADVVVDGLTLALSSSPWAAREALAMVRWARTSLGVHAILGLSNISFGLPARREINATLLSLARERDLTMVIVDPQTVHAAPTERARRALVGQDDHCREFIAAVTRNAASDSARDAATDAASDAAFEVASDAATDAASDTATDAATATLYEIVLGGDRDQIVPALDHHLDQGAAALEIIEGQLIPALQEVGARFQRREYFLPQLMLAAETMERAFERLRPLLETEQSKSAGTVVLATVQGDIHDIGKNIVGLMLRNHGFTVLDLGKDVGSRTIVETAVREAADLVMLSALMTTTMTQMPEVIAALRAAGVGAAVIIGGAVVTPAYAREIGADGYAPDAVGAVAVAKGLLRETGPDARKESGE